MAITQTREFDGIYQDGYVRPLEHLDIPENSLVKIQVVVSSAASEGMRKYKGILSTDDTIEMEEISDTVRYTIDSHIEILADKLDDNAQ